MKLIRLENGSWVEGTSSSGVTVSQTIPWREVLVALENYKPALVKHDIKRIELSSHGLKVHLDHEQPETKPTLEQFLSKYFDESGSDDKWVYYDLKEYHHAESMGESVSVVGVSHDKKKFTIHTLEDGEAEATENAVLSLDIYSMTKVT